MYFGDGLAGDVTSFAACRAELPSTLTGNLVQYLDDFLKRNDLALVYIINSDVPRGMSDTSYAVIDYVDKNNWGFRANNPKDFKTPHDAANFVYNAMFSEFLKEDFQRHLIREKGYHGAVRVLIKYLDIGEKLCVLEQDKRNHFLKVLPNCLARICNSEMEAIKIEDHEDFTDDFNLGNCTFSTFKQELPDIEHINVLDMWLGAENGDGSVCKSCDGKYNVPEYKPCPECWQYPSGTINDIAKMTFRDYMVECVLNKYTIMENLKDMGVAVCKKAAEEIEQLGRDIGYFTEENMLADAFKCVFDKKLEDVQKENSEIKYDM
ncbi:MAG: hypothetical protein LUD48_00305, partial [Prevotella sp.]|nr:hypothetical protein [Prevotella sp.]